MFRTIILICLLFIIPFSLVAQRIGNVTLNKGQVIQVRVDMTNNSFQTAGAQVINFKCKGSAIRNLTCTNVSPNRITIHYEMQEMAFTFDGMGQKMNFDSKNDEDLKNLFGPYFKTVLSKPYDIIYDSSGVIVSVKTDTAKMVDPDGKLATIIDMIKPIMDEVGFSNLGPYFFSLLPGDSATMNKPWARNVESISEFSNFSFKLNSITDSTVHLGITIEGIYNNSSEIMGRITKTSGTISGYGTMIIDRKTGLLKTKSYTANSKGTIEAMGGTAPINGKADVLVDVHVK